MELLSKAIIMATRAHDGQIDKAGKPYILHPLRVMMKVKSMDMKIVAVLHDIIEDTNLTIYDLVFEGFSNQIIDAIECLTKKENEDYMDFIERCRVDYIARIVKLADLDDNSDLSRIDIPTEKDYARSRKYKKAINYLLEVNHMKNEN